MQVCTACMVVSLLTTCMNFNTPPLAQNAPFDARFATQTRKYHSTKKLRKHVCHLILVCTIQSMLGRFVQLHLDHSSVSKRPAWLVYNHRPDKASALSLCHPRVSFGLLKVVRLVGRFSQSSRDFAVLACSCFALCIAHCLCFAPRCHDPLIVRSASNLSTVPWFHFGLCIRLDFHDQH